MTKRAYRVIEGSLQEQFDQLRSKVQFYGGGLTGATANGKIVPIPRRTIKMDIKYAAGFFDGEGHIALHISDRKHTNGRTYKRYQVECSVTQLEPDVLEMFEKRFGGYLYERKARATKSGEMHQRWDWKLTQQKCAAFLEEIAPHLIVKQEEAQIALEFARTFSEKTSARTAAVDMDTLLLRRELADKIKAVRAKKRAVSYGERGVAT